MTPAPTIAEAFGNPLLNPTLNSWDPSVDVAALYVVPRPGAQPLADGRQPVSVAERIRNQLLRAQGPLKIFLTGQVGAGKSSELSRLHADAEVAARFERVVVRLTERVELRDADIRQILVAIAATVAEHVRQHRYHEGKGWSTAEVSKDLRRWIDLLGKLFEVPSPNLGDDPVIEFGAAFAKFSTKLRSEHGLRQTIRQDQSFGPIELLKVTNLVLKLLEGAVERRVLLVIDDGDKIAMSDPARNVFIEHRAQLLDLRCLAVLTFPYALNFDPGLPTSNDLFVLKNIKIIEREAPSRVRPEAIGFFRDLLIRRVDASLITESAIVAAIRYSAGIPREFLRIVGGGFEFAYTYGYEQVDHDAIEYVVQELRETASRRTQGDSTRRALAQVHRDQRLPENFDESLLETLLVVEYSNKTPWYDVNPVLIEYVESFTVTKDGE